MRIPTLLTLLFLAAPAVAQDVPLRLYRDSQFPNGLKLGRSYGVSFGDYDADGWPDIVVCDSGKVWRNLQGTGWKQTFSLDSVLPKAGRRYGVSFGDYDMDGLPDIVTEPRNQAFDTCVHLLHNLGGGANFVDVATDPNVVIGQPCSSNAESFCWADVDGDGDLDLFLPIYGFAGSPGNAFWENLGPVGPNGEWQLLESAAAAGLTNPAVNNRAEGAQFADVDGDGDVDLYSNGTLYKNKSVTSPDFRKLTENASGIGLRGALDEGAVFLDYDMDGDYDLLVSYTNQGLIFWDNRGDGTFKKDKAQFTDPTSSDLGLSVADWDNDGDLDVTSQSLFHRNMLIETGLPGFIVGTTTISSNRTASMTPAWADWDRDGDLDCALGNFGAQAFFFRNITADGAAPEDKRYVRVRVVADGPAPRGLETEYGANVEVRVHGDAPGVRRRQFVAASAGYINQNEYALHFGLPPRSGEPLRFDVVVDFPGRETDGLLRVDPFVNPALGDIELESLADREITVYRSGRVTLDGKSYPAGVTDFQARLVTTSKGLAETKNNAPLPAPTPSPGANQFVGIAFSTDPDGGPLLVDELILDGQLSAPVPMAGSETGNLALWDVTGRVPRLVGLATRATRPGNDRSRFHLRFVLRPGRLYRLVAAVDSYRATSVPGPQSFGPLTVTGGLLYQDAAPSSGMAVVARDPDASSVYLALRFRRR